MRRASTDIAVIGAGVIGLTVALRLAQEGHSVVVLDPHAPGSGASYGNAGTIADYAVMPVGTPEVLRSLPSLLFDRNSPLSIRRAALPSLMPWLLRFARQSMPGPAARNATAIASLVADAATQWQALADEVGGTDLLQRRGCLYLYDNPADYRDAETDLAVRRSFGIEVDLIGPAELAALEPGLPPTQGGAAHFPQVLSLTDPGAMMAHLAATTAALGVEHIAVRVDRLERLADGLVLLGPGLRLRARRAVLAAGAHSRALAAQAGDRVPLDTERGYHVEWDMDAPRLSRPVCPVSRGFYLSPMAGRLRVVGTVELGGLTAPPSSHRIARLTEGARAYFPDLGAPSREWMGFRPSLPDSLPVIGPSQGGSKVIHAFGHGHIGVTLAPVTARIVADLVAGRTTDRDIFAFRPDRF